MNTPTLETGRKYVMHIFSESSFYNIPEYQRPYVWDSEQIEAFLDDISSAMENDKEKEYFLGCMIWNTRKIIDEKDNSYECQDILDGQQRFITMYLLQAVLRDLTDGYDFRETVNKCLKQKEDKLRRIPSRNRIVFEIREDASFLEKYVLSTSKTLEFGELQSIVKDNEYSVSIRNMSRGLLIIHEWWRNKQKNIEIDFQEYLSDFYTYLLTKVLALYLATPDNLDDAYNLFTVLNSRGIQLQNGDILRAQNLRAIESERLRKVYAQKWSDIENKIDIPFKNFDDFLWAFIGIKMKYSSDDNSTITKAFEFLHKRGKEKGGLEKGIHTIDTLGSYSNHFEAIMNGTVKTNKTGRFFSNLNFILVTTFGNQYLPIMMHYRECFGDYKIDDLLVRVDNLLSSAWLMGRRISSTRIYIILRKLESYFYSIELEDLTRDEAADRFLDDPVLTYAYKDEKSSAKPIDIDEFFNTLEQEEWGSFSGTKINKTRYLLLKLDLLRISKHDNLNFNKKRASVEHLMPRKMNPKEWKISVDDHNEWLHRLGNIVLIDRRKNAALSNRIYKIKLEKYKKDIEARAHTNYVFMTYNDNWDINTIKKNHTQVVNILKFYYTTNNINVLNEIRNLSF